jgi:predicted nucleotidyltransferase
VGFRSARSALESGTVTFDEVLTSEQNVVMDRVLAEESAHREHLVIYLSGAHAYGFPSPDSDLDLKAIHVATTVDLVGMEEPPTSFDRAEIIDGVEIDYTSNELAHVLSGVLTGNGNYLERILGRMVVRTSPLLDELRPVIERALSRRVYRHYRGFAQNQLRFLEKEPTVKKLLYVLRTTLTGIHLLETGEIEADLTRLADGYGQGDAQELVVRKRAGERVGLDRALLEAWRPRIDALFARLAEAHKGSVLPEEPPNEAEVCDWLLAVRRKRLL